MIRYDRAKLVRLAERAHLFNLGASDAQTRFLEAKDAAARATQTREQREATLSRRNPRFDANGLVREPADPELEKLRATEAEELAEVERLRLERDRLMERWQNARRLIDAAKDTLRNLGEPFAELERI